MSEKKYVHTNDVLTPTLLVIEEFDGRLHIEVYHRHDHYTIDKSELEAKLKELKQARV